MSYTLNICALYCIYRIYLFKLLTLGFGYLNCPTLQLEGLHVWSSAVPTFGDSSVHNRLGEFIPNTQIWEFKLFAIYASSI